MTINEILDKYGWDGHTGRVRFNNYAYILIAKKFGLDWNKLDSNNKIFLKGEMIEHFAGTSTINEEYWVKLAELLNKI